jgi:hypothetical protein
VSNMWDCSLLWYSSPEEHLSIFSTRSGEGHPAILGLYLLWWWASKHRYRESVLRFTFFWAVAIDHQCRISFFLSAEDFDNSTETLPGHGKMRRLLG